MSHQLCVAPRVAVALQIWAQSSAWAYRCPDTLTSQRCRAARAYIEKEGEARFSKVFRGEQLELASGFGKGFS